MKNHIDVATGNVFPRGALPTPRHLLAAAVPFQITAAPPPFFFIFPRKLSYWLNNRYGSCVTTEEAFNKACNGIYIDDATVMTWATSHGVLNGANLEPVISDMKAKGFAQDGNIYGDGSPLSVNYADAPTLQAAIYQAGQEGGCIKVGVAADELPGGAGNAHGWFMTSASPNSPQDHCMGMSGYGTAQQFVDAMNEAFGLHLSVPSGVDPNAQGYAMFTWSTIGFVVTKAMVNYVGEAWIRKPSSVNIGTGTPSPDSVFTTDPPVPPPPPGTPPYFLFEGTMSNMTPVGSTSGYPTITDAETAAHAYAESDKTSVMIHDSTGKMIETVSPTPPKPPAGSVTIPDQQIHVGPFGRSVTVHGGTYPVVYAAHANEAGQGEAGITIPPFVLAILKQVCNGNIPLPPAWQPWIKLLCGFLPANHAELVASNQGASVTVPPWLIPVLKRLCGFVPFLPPQWQVWASLVCGFLPHAAKPCGCQ